MPDAPDAESPLARAENVVAFMLDGREFTVENVVRAARFRGEFASHRQELLLKLACLEHAAAESLEADGEALQARADQFRYDHDLITTEETEQWLEARGIHQDQFTAHILRTFWHDQLGEKVEAEDNEPEDLERQIIVELQLGGAFNSLARDFAWRLAGRSGVKPGMAEFDERLEQERAAFFDREGIEADELPAWLESIGGSEAWFEEMLALEAAYSVSSAAIITPDGLTRALRTRRLGLMGFEAEIIEFDSAAAAREALLCVREDNMPMEEVAQESGYPYTCGEFVLDDMPADWQSTLLSTPEGGVAGPLHEGDLIRLFRIRRKIEPDIADKTIRARLEETLVTTHFNELCAAQKFKMLL